MIDIGSFVVAFGQPNYLNNRGRLVGGLSVPADPGACFFEDYPPASHVHRPQLEQRWQLRFQPPRRLEQHRPVIGSVAIQRWTDANHGYTGKKPGD